MDISHHADHRMNQRGIPRRLVDFALRHGRIGGVTVVADAGTVITTYNVAPRALKSKSPEKSHG